MKSDLVCQGIFVRFSKKVFAQDKCLFALAPDSRLRTIPPHISTLLLAVSQTLSVHSAGHFHSGLSHDHGEGPGKGRATVSKAAVTGCFCLAAGAFHGPGDRVAADFLMRDFTDLISLRAFWNQVLFGQALCLGCGRNLNGHARHFY